MTSSKGTGAGLQGRTEHLRADGELTTDELEHVSGGSPSHGGAPVRYMEFKLKEVFITSVH